MEPDVILQALESHLRPLVAAAGGTLDVAENPWDVVDLLKVTPAQWRVILSVEDEAPAVDLGPGGWVRGTFAVYIQRHKGFQASPGATIHKTTQPFDRLSHLQLAAKVRTWMRAVTFDSNDDIALTYERYFLFAGASWVDGSKEKDLPWRVRRLDFELIYALTAPELDPDPDGDNVVIPSALQITGVSEDGTFYLLASRGQAVGRVPRYAPQEGDPGGTGSGWRLLEHPEDPTVYIVSLSGTAHGRIPRYTAS